MKVVKNLLQGLRLCTSLVERKLDTIKSSHMWSTIVSYVMIYSREDILSAKSWRTSLMGDFFTQSDVACLTFWAVSEDYFRETCLCKLRWLRWMHCCKCLVSGRILIFLLTS